MKSTANAIDLRLSIHDDIVRMILCRIQMEHLKCRKFSLSTAGPESDESRIAKAWKELIIKAKITHEKQLLADLFATVEPQTQWICGIIGCYLSKYLTAPKHPLQVFMFFHKYQVYQRGTWDKSEDEILWKHIADNPSEPDLKFLQTLVSRPQHEIRKRIDQLLDERSKM